MLKSIYYHEVIGVPDTVHIDESFSLYDSIMKLRMTDKSNNKDYYLVVQFYKTILYGVSRVIYLKDYKKKCMSTRISDIVTEDEEALALWLLDNSEMKWRNKFLLKCDNERFKEKVKVCQAKYTQCISGHHPFQGWTNDGIEQFSNICQLVQEDRSKHQCQIFEEDFMKLQRNNTNSIMITYHDNCPKKEIAHSLEEITYESMFATMKWQTEMPSLSNSVHSGSRSSGLTSSDIPSSILTSSGKRKSNISKSCKYFQCV